MARPAAVLTALLGSLALVTTAAAQSVPLPAASPQRSGSTPPAAVAQQKPSAPMQLSPGQQPARPPADVGGARTPAAGVPAVRPPPQLRPGETTAFDTNQRALVDRVSTYLSSTRIMSGDFVQVGPDGK